MRVLTGYFHDFINLFFPEVCAGCGNSLFKNETAVCTACIYRIPYTGFSSDPENLVVKQLWGRFPFVQADAFLYFNKGGTVQNMMHELKYNNRPEVGYKLGELYGSALVKNPDWIHPDLIVPVPLHPRKLKKRGYNQAEHIAQGISGATGIPTDNSLLLRNHETETQTRKSRYDRYENMSAAFAVSELTRIQNTHILLVDDVITTGATFEGCAEALLQAEGSRISIAALAFSK